MHRKRGKGGPSLSKNIRVKFIGLLKCGLAPAIIAAWSFVKATIANYTVVVMGWKNITVVNETTGQVIGWYLQPITVDLGVIPTVLFVGAAIFLFISGLRELGGLKL